MDDPGVTILRAEATDVDAVALLTDASYAPHVRLRGGPPLAIVEVHGLRIERGQVWLLRLLGELMGVLVLELHPGYALIHSIAVAPAYQGEGHGGRMLCWAEERARAAGLGEIRLCTNSRMGTHLALYVAHGYREVGRRPNPYQPSWMMVDMAKSLAATA